MFQTKPACLLATLLFAISVGCDDGTVVVKGRVSVDGQPVNNGQLVLSPVGAGPRAFGRVAEDGSFRLVSAESKNGAFPGSYRVLFKYQLQLTDNQLAKLKRSAPGLSTEELTVSHKSPKDETIVVPESGVEDLEIEISESSGWKKLVSD